ncbi:MAG TPA: HEAT repeat domain-containing protein [Spirochaetota bacterium]|nr:HEAT repeat domain-containing protein [Spirochaetota bacterium]
MNRTVLLFATLCIGIIFGAFAITLNSRGMPVGLVAKSLARLPVFLIYPASEFENCAALAKADARALWKVRIGRATRVTDPFDFTCYAVDADSERPMLPDRITREIARDGGGSPIHRFNLAGSHGRILLTECGKHPFAINTTISGIAKPNTGDDTGVAMIIDNSHETPFLYPTVIFFWTFVLLGSITLARHQRTHNRLKVLHLELMAQQIVAEWEHRTPVKNELDAMVALLGALDTMGQRRIMIQLPAAAFPAIIAADTATHDVLMEAVSLLVSRLRKKSLPHLRDLFRRLDKQDAMKDVRLKALEMLQQLADRRQAPFLAGLLDHADDDILIGAIRALAACGTVKEVERLYRLGQARGDSTIRTAVREAIDAIQERLGKVDAGWLSLPDDSTLDGALSTPEIDRAGGLSDPEKDRKKKK